MIRSGANQPSSDNAKPRGLLALILLVCVAATAARPSSAGSPIVVRPPLRVDHDRRPIALPKATDVSELYAILYNSWFRPLNLEYHVVSASDRGSLNVNAWDAVPDSSWFTNRIGIRPMSFEDALAGLQGKSPEPGPWKIVRVRDEGYTPKLDIRDSSGNGYVLKFDLPGTPERNSAAERICTLIMHAAGYNVPYNTIVYFRARDLELDKDSYYRDTLKRRRPMTPADLESLLKRLKARPDGSYRGMASLMLPGKVLGPFVYTGRRKDDPNDIIPHELRRELRGMRVIASWINHADVKDINAMDLFVQGDYVKHYMLDFGSTMGSGDFIHGPYRVGHEYIYDGAATLRSLVSLGFYRRPWEVEGKIVYPEVGYYQAQLFDPVRWKPNYPNLAFLRMDDSDAYWGAKIVTAYTDQMVRRLAEAGDYSRPEVSRHLEGVMISRRDAIGDYWLDRITPLEELTLVRSRSGLELRFRDLALERGYAEAESRSYRVQATDTEGKELAAVTVTRTDRQVVGLPSAALQKPGIEQPDRFGRSPSQRILIQSNRRDSGWALPVEVVLGYTGGSSSPEILGWYHAPK